MGRAYSNTSGATSVKDAGSQISGGDTGHAAAFEPPVFAPTTAVGARQASAATATATSVRLLIVYRAIGLRRSLELAAPARQMAARQRRSDVIRLVLRWLTRKPGKPSAIRYVKSLNVELSARNQGT